MSSKVSEDEFERAVELRVREAQRHRLSQLGDEPLAWLALVPAWTTSLARACAFPQKPVPLPLFLERAETAGLCEVRHLGNPERSAALRSTVLITLAPYLPLQHQKQALQAVAELDTPRARAQALAQLSPTLPETLVDPALALALSIEAPGERALALVGMLPRLPPAQRASVVGMLYGTAQAVERPYERAILLQQLAPHFEGQRHNELLLLAVQAAGAVAADGDRAQLLARLAPHLPPSLLGEAIDICQGIEDVGARVYALIVLAAHAGPEQRRALLVQAATLISSIADEQTRARSLGQLAQAMAELGLFEEARTTANAISNEQKRAAALSRLVSAMIQMGSTKGAAVVAREVALSIEDVQGREHTIESLSAVLPGLVQAGESRISTLLLKEAEQVVNTALTPDPNINTIGVLIQAMSDSGQPDRARIIAVRTLDAVRALNDPRKRCIALTQLAPYLPAELREEDLGEALVAARSIADLGDRILAMANLVPQLSEKARAQVLDELVELTEHGADEVTFWMPDAARAQILGELQRQFGASFVHKTVSAIASRIERVQAKGVAVSPVVARWATLAAQTSTNVAQGAIWLDRRIGELLATGDIEQAVAWSNTGIALAKALGSELELTARVAARRIELLYRRAQDRRHLEHFLPRSEQIEDCVRLLKGPDEQWALHYIGAGGIGKTMLIRHIVAELAPELGWASSRIDFDHLSPDFPVRRPGQLLLELIDELRGHATTGRQDRLYQTFRNKVVDLHETLSGELTPDDPLANLHRSEFEGILRSFADFMGSMGQPVLLVLDTCEELAKLQPVGARLPSVEATFEILERIRRYRPSLRVIFAGRRLLAQGGHNWRVETNRLSPRGSMLPQLKSYLGLHEIRGFTRDEAGIYFSKIKKLALEPDLEAAILGRSAETAALAGITREGAERVPIVANQAEYVDAGVRYNPFDLNLYANWKRDDPQLDAATILAGETDPYIELRIIARITQRDVLSVLPAAVLLGRFDAPMLRVTCDLDDATLDEVFRDLGSQEWIDYQPDQALQTTFLEIDRNLQPRLRAYYAHPTRRAQLDVASTRLGDGLARLVRQRDLQQLGFDYVAAAMRLLVPAESAELWDHLSLRIAAQGAWAWARTLTERLLGEDQALADRAHPLWPPVRATYLAALLHERQEQGSADARHETAAAWHEVAVAAGAHTGLPSLDRQRLGERALAGAVRSVPEGLSLEQYDAFTQLLETFLTLDPDDELGQERAEQLGGALVAASEALLEEAGRPGTSTRLPRLETVAGLLARFEKSEVSSELRAFASVLAARYAALHDRWRTAKTLIEQAEPLLSTNQGPQPQRWADWRAPDALRERVRLEILRLLAPQRGGVPDERLLAWLEAARERLDTIDGERLASAILQRLLARGPLPEEILDVTLARETYNPQRQAVCWAHEATPPLFVTIARAWLARGDPDAALELLARRRQEATQSGRDQPTVRAAEQALLEALSRMRLVRRDLTLFQRYARSQSVDDKRLAWAGLTFDGVPLRELGLRDGAINDEEPGSDSATNTAQMFHLLWRTQALLDGQGATADAWLPEAASDLDALLDDTLLGQLALELDRVEMDHLGVPDTRRAFTEDQLAFELEPSLDFVERFGLGPEPSFGGAVGRADGVLLDQWFPNGPGFARQSLIAESDAILRLVLRATALGLPGKLDQHVQTFGPVLLAELALSEGELLALRLPAQAGELLARASRWFATADRWPYAFIAGVRSFIAAVQTGDWKTAAQRLDVLVEPSYQMLARSWPQQLRPWDELQPLRRSLDLPLPPDLQLNAAVWSAWLLRLLGNLVWLERGDAAATQAGGIPQPAPTGQYEAAVERALSELYNQRPPLELVPHQSARSRSSDTTSAETGSFDTLLTIVIVMVALAIIAAVIVGGYFLFAWLARPITESMGVGLVGTITIYALLLVLIPLSRSGLRRLHADLRSRLVAGGTVTLRISPPAPARKQAGGQAQPSAQLTLEQSRLSLRLGWPPTRRKTLPPLEELWQLPNNELYLTSANRMAKELVVRLAALQGELGRRTLPVRLLIDGDLDGLPWEALLTMALPDPIQPQDRPLHFWRSVTSYSSVSPIWQPGDKRVGVIVLANRDWQLLAERGWSQVEGSQIFTLRPEKIGALVSAVHVIGTPVRTHSGLMVQITKGADGGTPYREESSDRRGEVVLVGVDTVVGLRASLTLIQEEPGESEARSDTERERTGEMRAFAAQVAEAGAPAVLLLPALPSPLAERVVAAVDSLLARTPDPALEPFLDTIALVRRMIAEWPDKPGEARATNSSAGASQQGSRSTSGPANDHHQYLYSELALDVCLFLRSKEATATR